MTRSDSIAALAAALAKAQGIIEGASKDKENPHYRSKYADLASVWDACRAALSTNGLSVVQTPGDCLIGDSGAMLTLTTLLLHESGEFVEETMTIPVNPATAQGMGSALTYGRRYALAAFVGVAPEDDDGEAASTASTRPKRESKPAPVSVPETGIRKHQKEAFAVLEQLVNMMLADPDTLDTGPHGTMAREVLRGQLMPGVPFDKQNEKDWAAWVAALRKLRDANTPPEAA